jgi:hypothetical protein
MRTGTRKTPLQRIGLIIVAHTRLFPRKDAALIGAHNTIYKINTGRGGPDTPLSPLKTRNTRRLFRIFRYIRNEPISEETG